jgi:multisubunit Na+/H+ antiporter MnhC subunit
MFDLCLITNSITVQNFLKQLFSLICVQCGIIIFFLSFTLMVVCVQSITGTGVLLFFVVEGGLSSINNNNNNNNNTSCSMT